MREVLSNILTLGKDKRLSKSPHAVTPSNKGGEKIGSSKVVYLSYSQFLEKINIYLKKNPYGKKSLAKRSREKIFYTIRAYFFDAGKLNDKNMDVPVEISAEVVRRYQEKRSQRKLTVSTVNKNDSCVKRFLFWMGIEVVGITPTPISKTNEIQTRSLRAVVMPTRQEFADFMFNKDVFDYFEFSRWRSPTPERQVALVVGIILSTGLRVSEVMALHAADIGEQGKTIVVDLGKGGKQRVVNVFFGMDSIIKAVGFQAKGYLFPDFFGKIAPLRLRVKVLTKKHFLFPYTPHDLRHIFCRFCAQTNLHPEVLRRQMGHYSFRTTYNYYMAEMPKEVDTGFSVKWLKGKY